MDDVTLARALHVLGVIHWIGGLAFVTLVVLPLAARTGGGDGVALFEAVEQRFSAQVRLSIPLVGASGFWMVHRLDLWSRFTDPTFWWMGAMAGLWSLFMLLLFVVEPLAHRRATAAARAAPRAMLARVGRLHLVLLFAAAVTAFGAVAGSHGLFLF